MIITVDCNSDRLTINNKMEFPCRYPNDTLRILSEIFNILNLNGIIIEKIDEDNRTIIEEW